MPTHRLQALIVEDEPETILVLLRILASAGYGIAGTAVNGAEAIEVARQSKPDFILMDTNMPVLNGIEATRQIMAERPVPIIMLTGYDMEEHLDAALEAGACAYITKPVRSSHLVLAIGEALTAFREAEHSTVSKNGKTG
jgi:response regulator NasT